MASPKLARESFDLTRDQLPILGEQILAIIGMCEFEHKMLLAFLGRALGFEVFLGFLTFTNNFKVNTAGGSVDNNGLALLMLSGLVSDGNGTTGMLRLTDSSGGGFGATVLSGPNTYSGGTTVIGTTVQVTNNSSVGTGTVTLENGLFQAGATGLTFSNNFKINNTPFGSIIDANGPGPRPENSTLWNKCSKARKPRGFSMFPASTTFPMITASNTLSGLVKAPKVPDGIVSTTKAST